MLDDMKIYFSPFATLFAKTVMYKKGMLLPVSTALSIGIEITHKILNTSFLGVSTSFLILISVLFMVDFWTGVMASRFEELKAIREGNKKEAYDKKFNSRKITFTFFKFLMLFLWIWLADIIGTKFEDLKYMNTTYEIITTIPLVLVTLREYISIGENIERRFNKSLYIFKLVEKIFEILEGKFFKKLGDDKKKK